MAFNLQDQMLRAYIDKIFDKYDTDSSGTLDEDQLTFFFNDLFKELGIGMSVTKEQSLQAIRSIDQNSDGSVDKRELFDAFRKMMSKPQIPQQPQMMNTSYNQPHQQPYNQPYQPYNQPYSPPPYNNPYQPVYHNPYGMHNPYTSPPPQYNPYNNSPYNNPPPNQQPYNPYSQHQSYGGYNGGYMGGSMNSSTGNRWGRMQ